MNNSNVVSSEYSGKTINRMVEYINNKYSTDEFTYDSPYGGGAGASAKMIAVQSSSYPGEAVYVRFTAKDGSEIFTDNFLCVKYKDSTVHSIEDILSGISESQSFIAYTPSKFACPNSSGEMSFREFLSNPKSEIKFTAVICADCSDRKALEQKLQAAVSEAGICCLATIYFENDPNTIPSISQEGFSAYIHEKTYSAALTFETDRNAALVGLSWGD